MKPFFVSAIAVNQLVLKKLNGLLNPLSMMLCILVLFFLSPVAWAGHSDYQQYFPETLQGWKGGTSYLDINNPAVITGWSEPYIENNQGKGTASNGNTYDVLYLGFNSVANSDNTYGGSVCTDELGCAESRDGKSEERKAPTPTPITTIPSPLPTSSLSIDNSDSPCSDESLCHVELSDGATNLYIDADLDSLNMSVWSGSAKLNVILSGQRYIRDIYFQSGGNTTLVFKDDLILTTETMDWSQGAAIDSGKGVLLNVITSFKSLASKLLTDNPMFFYSPNGSIEVSATGSGDDFYGCLLAKTVKLNNGLTINGAVTTQTIEIHESSNKITGNGSCVASIPDPDPDPDATYSIEVTPDEGYYLSCDTPNITFTVKDDNGEIATDYDGNINATFPNGLVPNNANIIQGKVIDAANNVYQPVNGQVIVPVTSGEYKSYDVEGELADDSSQTDTGNIEFVPFAFYVDDQHAIASKPQSVEVKALACDSDTHDKVAVNYSGTPDVTSSLQEPSGGVGTLDFAPDFTSEDNGDTSSDLTFSDSGKVRVTLEDKNFDCTGYDGCPIGEDGKTDGVMKGGFTVYSRPWTFAICDVDGSAMDGNITDSTSLGYKAAGQPFDLHVRPLRWVSGETDPIAGAENIDVTDLCDKPITQNYLSSGSPDSTIKLSYELAQPSPDVGHEGSLSGTPFLINTESSGSGESGYYDFAQLAWSEVGVLTVKMDTPEDEKYYDMNINQGYRHIGRFYPDHLAILQNSWEYAEGHNEFAYMNQPIGMMYTVEARSVDDTPTQNYGYFTTSLQAQLKVVGVDENSQNLADRFYVGDEGTDVGWSSITPVSERNAQYAYSTSNFEFYKLNENDAPYSSVPDGPFNADNSNWGMEVTDSTVDQVNFDFNDNSFTVDTLNEKAMAFNEKPNFRYGRMVLDSVSSPINGPVSVPLRAEYWDSESYIINEDDNGSQFKTDVYCAIDEETAAANDNDYLTDTSGDSSTDKVEQGTSSIVQAGQKEGKRETVRIFLRQGNDGSENFNNPLPEETCEWHKEEQIAQPWLQFNWRDKGDENPSTVVSFGAYRGNDRIIYRGEEQLTEN